MRGWLVSSVDRAVRELLAVARRWILLLQTWRIVLVLVFDDWLLRWWRMLRLRVILRLAEIRVAQLIW